MVTPAGRSRLQRAVVAVLAALLPAGFRDRQRAEWLADLADLAADRPAVRGRYPLAAAWTLPALRSLVRSGRTGRRLRPLGGGLLRRGRPDRRAAGVLAVLVALLAGLYGAAGATRLGWELATPLPTDTHAEELKQAVFPGVAVAGGGNAPLWTFSPDGEYVEFGAAGYVVAPTETRDIGDLILTMRDRLAARGWRTADDAGGAQAPLPTRTSPLQATRDGLTLTYSGGPAFTVARAVPSWLGWQATRGGLAVRPTPP